MSDDVDYLRLLRNKAQHILSNSPGMESMPGVESVPTPDTIDPGAPPINARSESAQLEAVVHWYRPVLEVVDDRFLIKTEDDEGDPRFHDPNEGAAKSLLDALE